MNIRIKIEALIRLLFSILQAKPGEKANFLAKIKPSKVEKVEN